MEEQPSEHLGRAGGWLVGASEYHLAINSRKPQLRSLCDYTSAMRRLARQVRQAVWRARSRVEDRRLTVEQRRGVLGPAHLRLTVASCHLATVGVRQCRVAHSQRWRPSTGCEPSLSWTPGDPLDAMTSAAMGMQSLYANVERCRADAVLGSDSVYVPDRRHNRLRSSQCLSDAIVPSTLERRKRS